MMTINGLPIIIHDDAMSKFVTDTSLCRSPSRALRRLKLGIVGRTCVQKVARMEAVIINNKIVMHSAFYAELLHRTKGGAA